MGGREGGRRQRQERVRRTKGSTPVGNGIHVHVVMPPKIIIRKGHHSWSIYMQTTV